LGSIVDVSLILGAEGTKKWAIEDPYRHSELGSESKNKSDPETTHETSSGHGSG